MPYSLFTYQEVILTKLQWKFAASEPRTIDNFTATRSGHNAREISTAKRQATHPSILKASRESRFEGLRFYSKCTKGILQPLVETDNFITVFINFEIGKFALHSAESEIDSLFDPASLPSRLGFDASATAKIAALARNFEINISCTATHCFVGASQLLQLYHMLGEAGRSFEELDRVNVCVKGSKLVRDLRPYLHGELYRREMELIFALEFQLMAPYFPKRNFLVPAEPALPAFLSRYRGMDLKDVVDLAPSCATPPSGTKSRRNMSTSLHLTRRNANR